jgi:hypothetical protein
VTRARAALIPLLALAGGIAAIYLGARALLVAPCWALIVLVALAAWPVWLHHREFATFHRRALLDRAMRDDSRVRRWLWSGHVARVVHVFTAMFWGALLLVFASALDAWHWAVVGADALLLALAIGPVRQVLSRDVRSAHVGLVARRWPLFGLNVAALAVAFLLVDFFVVGAPDTRGITWHGVAEGAFTRGSALAACPLAGGLTGVRAVVEALAWHASEILIPSLPAPGLRLAAWLVFLLQAGALAVALTYFYLGIAAWVERRAASTEGGSRDDSSRDFLFTIAALAALWLYASVALRGADLSWLAARGRDALAWANPCRAATEPVAAVRARLATQLEAGRTAEHARAGAQIDAAMDGLFGEVEHGVDAYLDWYFTVIGEYQRLFAWGSGSFPELMARQLEKRLFGDHAFAERIERASRDIATGSDARMGALAARLGGEVQSGVRANPCWIEALDVSAFANLERDAMRASVSAGGGVAVGALTAGLLARRAATAAAGKAASKRVFQGAASVAGRVAAKRAGSFAVAAAGGAAACAPGGPLAALCALAAGAAGWITFDKAFIEVDQLRFRGAMREELLQTLREQKAELSRDLRALHGAAIDRNADAIGASMDGAFIPARDGR